MPIVLSRHRKETPSDRELADALAARTGRDIVCIPFLYDLRRSGKTVQTLREIAEPMHFLAPFPCRATVNLLETLGFHHAPDAIVSVTGFPASDGLDKIIELLENTDFFDASTSNTGKCLLLDEPTVSRWYPIIDREECTGCLECVNFCLFGVYTIGDGDLPLVDQPDACRDGCPACSRVCPAAAILFPMHEDEDIAGWNDPESVLGRRDAALAEKERQRHVNAEPFDELDDLIDEVDRFET